MKNYKAKFVSHSNSRGGVLVLVALLLVVFVGVTALAIDIGYLSTTRNELQNVADAAALAGAGYLGSEYVKLPPVQHGTKEFTRSEIVDVIQKIAGENKAAKNIVSINDNATDIRIGLWNPNIRDIDVETLKAPDAVYVKARRDTEANSPISTFFAGIFGIETMPVTAEAVAALSGPSTVAEGELFLPVGLSENVFKYDSNLCTNLIQFSPTPDSCAAWHNFEDSINGNAMEEKLMGIIEGHSCEDCGTLTNGLTWMEANFDVNHNSQYPGPVTTPAFSVGTSFEFNGGQISKLLTPGSSYLLPDYDTGLNSGNEGTVDGNTANPQDMTALFDYFRYRDGDGIDAEWSTSIPVYKDDTIQGVDSIADCDNANKGREIMGFARIVMEQTNPPPSTSLAVRVDCNVVVVEGRGGGGTYGNIKGSVPNLVK